MRRTENAGLIMHTKKILFVTIASGVAASTRVRVHNLVPELEKRGFSAKTVRFPKTLPDQLALLRLCRQSDVVFLQKRTPTLLYGSILRLFSRRLIYDFDDAIYYKPNDPDDTKDPQRLRRFENIVRIADLVIAGNDILADEARKHNPRCTVLPSAVETRNIPFKDYRKSGDKFVIGWVGNIINLPCLEQLAPAFRELAKRHAIQLRIISGETLDVPGIETVFIPWAAETQDAEICQFDVGVMPLFDYPHTRGKCAYKALQYMAAGVPPVVSDVGINSRVVEHGVSGFVARNFCDYVSCIEQLIVDRSLIARMGEKAKARIRAQFSVECVGRALAGMLD